MHGVRLQARDRKDTMNLIYGGVRDILTEKDGRLLEIWGLT
jgi:hypothetical protein